MVTIGRSTLSVIDHVIKQDPGKKVLNCLREKPDLRVMHHCLYICM
jgi:hypothetical protein